MLNTAFLAALQNFRKRKLEKKIGLITLWEGEAAAEEGEAVAGACSGAEAVCLGNGRRAPRRVVRRRRAARRRSVRRRRRSAVREALLDLREEGAG